MTEGKARWHRARVVPAVADEQAFAVANLAELTGKVAVRRIVLDATGKRGRESATRLGRAGQHVHHRVGHLLAAEPHLKERRRLIGPIESNGRAGVQHDHRAGIGREHARSPARPARRVDRGRSGRDLRTPSRRWSRPRRSRGRRGRRRRPPDRADRAVTARDNRSSRRAPLPTLDSSTRSSPAPARPATSSTSCWTSSLPNPKKSLPRPGGLATPSITTSPSSNSRAWPVWINVKVWVPVSVGVKVPVAVSEKSSAGTFSCAAPSNSTRLEASSPAVHHLTAEVRAGVERRHRDQACRRRGRSTRPRAAARFDPCHTPAHR